MKILIGTKNPEKIEGARKAFENYFTDFEIEGISVSSGVGEEPVNKEIYEGAKNRVEHLRQYAKENGKEADYYLGVESGITNLLGKWIIINIAVIKDKEGYESWGTSQGFPVPDKYVDEIIKTDLGQVMQSIARENNLQSGKAGIGFLTNEVVTRIDQTREAFVMALTQYINGLWNDRRGKIEMEKKIVEFLIEAKKQTYANEHVKKLAPSRVGSKDYEYQKDGMTYHDTFFGGTDFVGEEVVYLEDETPIWGMNYYGVTLDEALSEETMDKALRPALMQVGSDDTLPVRGPKEFVNGEYKYTFDVTGDINRFEGEEAIYKNEEKIYSLKCHGGRIKK